MSLIPVAGVFADYLRGPGFSRQLADFDGSISPVEFRLTPQEGEALDITEVVWTFTAPFKDVEIDGLGNGGLANGFLFRPDNPSLPPTSTWAGQPLRNFADFAELGWHIAAFPVTPQAVTDEITVQLRLRADQFGGSPIRIDSRDSSSLLVVVRDDITPLSSSTVIAYGQRVHDPYP